MSGKLDKSLDDILSTRRTTGGRRTRTIRGRPTARPRTSAAGGITKTTKVATKTNAKDTRPPVPSTGSGDSKIIVSGLPSDVSETQIKEYFTKTIGPVKKVFLTYGPTGQSRGVSTIVFSKPGSAVEAATQLNGVKVDNRAMKIEVIVGAEQAPAPAASKALGDRIVQKTKTTTTTTKNGPKASAAKVGKGAPRVRRGRNANRRKPKTADELDAEMVDYFDAPAGGAVNGEVNGNATTNGATGGDTGMEDEIM